MDIVQDLVENIVNTTYKELPREAVEGTKITILGTVGVLAAGAYAPGCATVVDLVREWGGKGESTILVHGGKIPSNNAAMVNSMMARALEFDAGMANQGLHRSASTVPTALAVSEMRGSVSGEEFLAAIALGDDLASRLNLVTTNRGFCHTGICMPLGASAVAGKLLGLDKKQMLNALGIAFNQASGSIQARADGALVDRMIQGFASRSGVESAILAKRGITGAKNILQGIYGFFNLFSRTEANLPALTDKLGQTFHGAVSVGFKKYPSCGLTIGPTQLALDLVREHDIKPQDVDEIKVGISEGAITVVGRPFTIRDSPQVDAQFSIPYTVANVLLRRDSKLEHFTDESIMDPRIQPIAQKIRVVSSGAKGLVSRDTTLEIRMKDGSVWSKSAKYRKGSPQDPLTKEELLEKFRACMSYGPKSFSHERTEGIIRRIGALEELADVSELADSLLP